MKFFCLFVCILLSSCEERDLFNIEQTIFLELYFTEDIPRFTAVYGLGKNKEPLLNIVKKFDERRREFYNLPISLHQDTVRYVLKSLPANSDTLSLAYKKYKQYSEGVIKVQVKNVRILPALTTFSLNKLEMNNLRITIVE